MPATPTRHSCTPIGWSAVPMPDGRARDTGTIFSAWQFTATGSVFVPAQLAAAAIGLHLTGALG